MEAEELAVAYPTVQHAVDVDVVGLQVEEQNQRKRKRLKQKKGCVNNRLKRILKKDEMVSEA